ncbi:capsule biosynthesis GfcC family protein [Vibrio sp. JC009]|uniref:capsule biosynthesis GfcC family protein n=1 Tax=Vibrio sp. JC009 TaxID=2912314 RepID=UPI0023B19F36|nr:capsule biosynthesis GfcC family protein [Vibrio sp. JC009]WED24140.1 capsule biosynthesis GfcC family protein [Vibrio sp. JC009]
MSLVFRILFVLSSAFSVLASASEAKISLPSYSATLVYKEPVRLSQVLSETNAYIYKNKLTAPYWLGAQLIEPAKNSQIEVMKKKVLEKLNYLSRYHTGSTFKADLLSDLLNKAKFGYRHFIPLDNDLIRLKLSLNPVLEGVYSLISPPRTNNIFVVGTTTSLAAFKLKGHQPLNTYIEQASLPQNSNDKSIFIIQPDGALSVISDSYWKNQTVFLAPGALLYIGFEDLPERMSGLNREIAELLRYMEPPTQGSQQ